MKRLLFAVMAFLMLTALPHAALADTEALVINGGFEEIATSYNLPKGWDYTVWDQNVGALVSYEAAGDRGNVVKLTTGSLNDVRLYQKITVEPDSFYRFSCEVKTEDVSDGAGANISIEDAYAKSAPLYGTNDWTRIEFYGLTHSTQTTLSVCVRIGGFSSTSTGTAWFDNVTVEKVESIPSGAEAQNLYLEATDNSNSESENENTEAPEDVPHVGDMAAMTVLTLVAGAVVYAVFLRRKDSDLALMDEKRSKPGLSVILVLFIALILRVACHMLFQNTGIGEDHLYGHSTDIKCFSAWGNRVLAEGPAKFYAEGYFCDYPPGYLYILGAFSGISSLLGFTPLNMEATLILKLPAILADLGIAYMIYRLSRSLGRPARSSMVLMGLYLFNPVTIFISSVWGQIDSLLTLLLLGSAMLFMTGLNVSRSAKDLNPESPASTSANVNWRLIVAGALYGLAILIKPQASMFGPIFALAYICYIIYAKQYSTSMGRAFLTTVLAVLSACAVIIAFSLPFFGVDGVFSLGENSLIAKYIGTATSYNYATIEAFNFMGLIGGNWQSADNVVFLGITYAQLGTVFMILVGLTTAVFYVINVERNRSLRFFILCLAFLMIGFFTLGHFMHERYLFPGLVLLLVAAILYNDRRLYALFTWFSASMLLNTMSAFVVNDWRAEFTFGATYETLVLIGSIMTVVGFIALLYVVLRILVHDTKSPMFYDKLQSEEPKEKLELNTPTDNKLHFVRRDWIFICAITIIYAVVALTNLGTTQAPETHWEAGVASDPAVITIEGDKPIASVYVFGGIAKDGTITFTDDTGTVIEDLTYTQEYGHMYRWRRIANNLSIDTNTLTVAVDKGNVNFIELAIYDTDGNLIPVNASGEGALLVDEQSEIPDEFSRLNGMYFDELYHARTGYEHLHGLSVYEVSHPPLGKIFISIGIGIFGMNALGWRIIGTLFGVAMVPIMYCFAKRLFKRPEYALLTTVLFTFDFMHFVQTRIATIDTYGVFFILLMFYYMYQYYTMSFYRDGLKRTLKPLGLAGLFFGLGAASKWICIYAGAGLAIMLLISLIQRYNEYCKIKAHGTDEERERVKCFPRYVIYTLLWCCLFYIVIPVIIYSASFLVYPDVIAPLKEGDFMGFADRLWYYQDLMFGYHSGLREPHPYQSAWYEWPLILRPMWYYSGSGSATIPAGMAASITSFGNPMVWWACLAGTIGLAAQMVRGKIRSNPVIIMLFVGIISNFAPWMLVTRSTYIYHYFATLPFVIFASVYLLKYLEEKFSWLSYIKWGWMCATTGLFALFYPVLTGVVVPRKFIELLQWLPRWTFMGVDGPDSGRWFGLFVMLLIALAFIVAGMISYKRYQLRLSNGDCEYIDPSEEDAFEVAVKNEYEEDDTND